MRIDGHLADGLTMSELVETARACTNDQYQAADFERTLSSAAEPARFNAMTSFDQACEMTVTGWSEPVPDAMRMASAALRSVADEQETTSLDLVSAPFGARVNVARFVAGVPECMVLPKLTKVSRAGRVVSVCASVVSSGGVSPEELRKRGAAAMALVMAIERTGHSVELIADYTTDGRGRYGHSSRYLGRTRVIIKRPTDRLDPALAMFALGHAAFQRQLVFRACSRLRTGSNATPKDPIQDLPDGTIYLPSYDLWQSSQYDGETFVRRHLGELGLMAD